MIHFSRLVPIALTLSCVAFAPLVYATPDTMQLVSMQGPDGFLLHGAQGYLGVGIRDVDADRATALKLKQPQGAEITYLDQDAPASKAGLKVRDVILQMNGQQVEGVEQLRRMLHETPPGRSVSFVISRDGQTQTISLQLEDRTKVEQTARAKIFVMPQPEDTAPFDTFVMPPAKGSNSLFNYGLTMSGHVDGGAVVHPISPQLADFFGDKEGSGLLVESVEDNSPAAAAGLKAGDVILKVNDGIVGTPKEWLRAIHANKGKTVQVTVLRNRREQVLSMQAGDAKNKSEVDMPLFLTDDAPLVAMLRGNLDGLDIGNPQDLGNADALRQGAAMLKEFKLAGPEAKKLQEQMKRGQEDLRKSLKMWQQDLGPLDVPDFDGLD